MNCPHCAGTRTKPQAKKTKLGYSTFFCSKCRCTFNERTGTPFNYLEFPTDIVLLAVLWRLRYKLSLRDIAEGTSSSQHHGAFSCVPSSDRTVTPTAHPYSSSLQLTPTNKGNPRSHVW
jgi:Transposase and inactivated derivatives